MRKGCGLNMQYNERDKLFKLTSEYLSIGITSDGKRKVTVAIPWETTAHAYNMCIPDVYISPDDLSDKEIMCKIRTFKVIGCYVWESLLDYAFITDFAELQDLYIICGDGIRNLDFLTPLHKCRMLFLGNAHLNNIDKLIELNAKKDSIFDGLKCVGLYNCTVQDISAFEKKEHYFMEFLVWEPKSNGQNRWNKVKAARKRHIRIE